ncbi:MAG: hypothetical protein WC600_03295 [Desulfobaccales bacterium]
MNKTSITIATPHRRSFSPEYVLSLAETLRDGRFNYNYLIREGSTLHHQRNSLCREFLKGPGEYLLFVDSDQCWMAEDVELLMDVDKDIVTGLIFMKTYPAQVEIVPLSGSLKSLPDEPFELASAGTGFLLIRRRVLEAFFERRIWPFDPLPIHQILDPTAQNPGIEGDFPSGYYWEDLSFSVKARQLGFSIWCEPRARIGHIGPQIYLQTPDLAKWFKSVGKAGYEGFSGKGFAKA